MFDIYTNFVSLFFNSSLIIAKKVYSTSTVCEEYKNNFASSAQVELPLIWDKHRVSKTITL